MQTERKNVTSKKCGDISLLDGIGRKNMTQSHTMQIYLLKFLSRVYIPSHEGWKLAEFDDGIISICKDAFFSSSGEMFPMENCT